MLQRLRLCRTSDTVFRREIDSRRQWGYGTCYGGIVSPLRRSVGTVPNRPTVSAVRLQRMSLQIVRTAKCAGNTDTCQTDALQTKTALKKLMKTKKTKTQDANDKPEKADQQERPPRQKEQPKQPNPAPKVTKKKAKNKKPKPKAKPAAAGQITAATTGSENEDKSEIEG